MTIRRKAMLIGFDGSRAFLENRTGTENYSYQLLSALSKIDIENQYLVYLRPGQDSGKNWPINFKFKVINFPRLWTQAGLAFQTFIDPIDVLFVPAHTLPLIRKPGLKTVITVHDLGAEYLPGFHQLKQILYLKFMTYYQLKTATKIIAVSEATKKDLIKKIGLAPDNIKVIYEGVDEELKIEHPQPKIDIKRNILNKFSLEKNKYFLFVGTIQPRKNLERLIKAFTAFLKNSGAEDFKLVLAGQKGWKTENIYSLPSSLGVKDKVIFAGRTSDEELAVLYSQAAALTYPSLFEGFGLPILEAFSSSCPVITSNISSMPEIAGDAAFLVNPEDEAEISLAMLKITTNDKLRNSLIQKGLRRSRDFSWEKTARETVQTLTT